VKKTLFALAVLSLSGPSIAQSTVTLYGVADAWVGSVRDAGVRNTVLQSGGLNGSRWGLRGSEDLGGGLKANFQLESGFSIDTGNEANGASMFGRQAYVGLSSNFGEVRLGRQYSAYDELRGATNNTADSDFASTAVWSAGGDYLNRINNQGYYATPDFNGFSAAVGHGGLRAGGGDPTKYTSLHVKYAKGPLLVGYAHQREDDPLVTTAEKYNLVAGSYDFGPVQLVAGINRATGATDKENEYQVGVSAPFGATTLYVGYANSRAKDLAGATTEKGTGLSALVTHDLSKRTAVYVGINDYEIENGVGVKLTDTQLIGVGVRHNF
jgi:predicted porin